MGCMLRACVLLLCLRCLVSSSDAESNATVSQSEEGSVVTTAAPNADVGDELGNVTRNVGDGLNNPARNRDGLNNPSGNVGDGLNYSTSNGNGLNKPPKNVDGLNNPSSSVGDKLSNRNVVVVAEKLNNQTKRFEKGLRDALKNAIKGMMPMLMSYNDGGNSSLSPKCMKSLLKYISSLTTVKVWAIKMLDSTSKLASGILEGTFSDFGAFDQCLEIVLPDRKGMEEFRGQYCAIEARPRLPDIPRNFSLSRQPHAGPLDSIGYELQSAGSAFYYLKFRLGVCLPSPCSRDEVQTIADKVGEVIEMNIEIPKCYVKEEVVYSTIHIVVICVLAVLLLLCCIGTLVDYKTKKNESSKKNISTPESLLVAFSLTSNFTRLLSSSKGSEELKALHGIRAFSMAWVILGHTYVWINFQLLRRPSTLQVWFNKLDFEAILNAWLSVEPFFFLSGLLTSYAALKIMEKTKGKINIPLYIIRRYIRLTPPLLLAMGLVFFMPLVSSGPFWYERVDPEVNSCTYYWWTSLLYISNWTGMKQICLHPTWYLSADFQMHIASIIFLYALYKSPKLGLLLIAAYTIVCNVIVGVLTYLWDLPPTIQISSGNNEKIEQTVDVVHIRTFTHAGPYLVGIVVGYLMVKHREVKINRVTNLLGWCVATVLCVSSLYGAHKWNIGEAHGSLVTALYAGVHRTTFTLGIGWVTFACVTGHGGLVNRFLSSPLLAPVSRLTFLVYLLHSLVIWVRMGSLRERIYYSHYNLLYEYVANICVSVLLTVPFYLLLEAPLSNLERLAFSRAGPHRPSGHSAPPLNNHLSGIANPGLEQTAVDPDSVQLTSVKSVHAEINGKNGDLKYEKGEVLKRQL